MQKKRKKEILKRYNFICEKICRLENKKAQLWEKAAYIGPCLDKTPLGTPDGTRTERIVEKINQLEVEIVKAKAQRTEIRQSIEAAISELKDRKEQEVLKRMYLGGEAVSLVVVAERMNYSFRHTQRLYARALEHIKITK